MECNGIKASCYSVFIVYFPHICLLPYLLFTSLSFLYSPIFSLFLFLLFLSVLFLHSPIFPIFSLLLCLFFTLLSSLSVLLLSSVIIRNHTLNTILNSLSPIFPSFFSNTSFTPFFSPCLTMLYIFV